MNFLSDLPSNNLIDSNFYIPIQKHNKPKEYFSTKKQSFQQIPINTTHILIRTLSLNEKESKKNQNQNENQNQIENEIENENLKKRKTNKKNLRKI
ncbi:det1- and ddb1-associated protein [Anaeramoeba ignava]|uniref:Det1- and ddb1-associated protein n=1 Tax=Anaeramoeba ignava TaxID=1746090 RepID=A0A9Q0LER0_ANAIG|nr:det1- and ddb1-associated protein [Anaeramoeba ignava]